jgi:hypothetical protein
MKNTPSFYAILPANVRYDSDLTWGAKVLYAEITALCNSEGYCWARNKYFEELFAIGKDTTLRILKQLENKGFIKIEYVNFLNTDAIQERRIYVSEGVVSKMRPGGLKNETRSGLKNETVYNTLTLNTRKSIDKSIPKSNVLRVFQTWSKELNHPNAKLDDNRTRRIEKALELGYTVEQLCLVPLGAKNSPWNMGDNPTRTKYDSIDLLFRNAENIEKFISLSKNEKNDTSSYLDSLVRCLACEAAAAGKRPCHKHDPNGYAKYKEQAGQLKHNQHNQ